MTTNLNEELERAEQEVGVAVLDGDSDAIATAEARRDQLKAEAERQEAANSERQRRSLDRDQVLAEMKSLEGKKEFYVSAAEVLRQTFRTQRAHEKAKEERLALEEALAAAPPLIRRGHISPENEAEIAIWELDPQIQSSARELFDRRRGDRDYKIFRSDDPDFFNEFRALADRADGLAKDIEDELEALKERLKP